MIVEHNDLILIKEMIAKIEQLDLKTVDIETIKKMLEILLRGHVLSTPILKPGTVLYRGRKISSRNQTKHVKDLLYPTPELIHINQRCNRAGTTLFYSSLRFIAPFAEIDLNKGDLLALSRWVTLDKLIVNNVGYSDNAFEALNSTRRGVHFRGSEHPNALKEANLLVKNFLAKQFTLKIVSGQEHLYKISIAIAEKMTYSGDSKNAMGLTPVKIDGLLYPSIAVNGNTDNIALNPGYVDKNLRFLQVDLLKVVERDGNKVRIQPLDVADKISSQEEILWRGFPGEWKMEEVKTEEKFWYETIPLGNG